MGFNINGTEIEIVEHYRHLGHIINSAFNDNNGIIDKCAVFIGQANNVLGYFDRLTSSLRQHLFNSYCTRFFRLRIMETRPL